MAGSCAEAVSRVSFADSGVASNRRGVAHVPPRLGCSEDKQASDQQSEAVLAIVPSLILATDLADWRVSVNVHTHTPTHTHSHMFGFASARATMVVSVTNWHHSACDYTTMVS